MLFGLGKLCQRLLVGGTVNTVAGRAQYPLAQLRIGVSQAAELAQGKEVGLDVFDARPFYEKSFVKVILSRSNPNVS